MRLALDSNVLVAALRSPQGASRALLLALRARRIEAVASVTFNTRHFTPAAARFGIDVLTPAQAIWRVQ